MTQSTRRPTHFLPEDGIFRHQWIHSAGLLSSSFFGVSRDRPVTKFSPVRWAEILPWLTSGGRRGIVIIQQQLAVFADVLLKWLANFREGTADFAPPATLLAQVLPCRFLARLCLG